MESSSVGDDSEEWDLYLKKDFMYRLASSSLAAVAFKASLEGLWILHYYLSGFFKLSQRAFQCHVWIVPTAITYQKITTQPIFLRGHKE
ncbi:unnamed protein product, partial [Musa textilis]